VFLTVFIYLGFLLSNIFIPCQAGVNKSVNTATSIQTAYYISNDGNDNNNGSKEYPLKTFKKIAGLSLNAGDSVLLQGSQIFIGTLAINYDINGTAKKPVVISSYGIGIATINSTTEKGLVINNSSYMIIQNIKLIGAGRKNGNTTSGVNIAYCKNITINNIDISGYQKAGLLIRNCSNMIVTNVMAHDNGSAGISVGGENFSKTDCRNIDILFCRAENNPGDPTNKDNHSGNGIVISQCTNAKISYCTATNNGWDMPRIGNGPVGIWAWESDSVTIEHCLSYRNKTSNGGEDGGGFDFDGGITNSVLQYCLSYENDGSGIGLFQFSNASPWKNNIVRYNISINDGNVSAAKAGIFIWNLSPKDNLQQCYIYNNTIYNNKNAAINYSVTAANKDIFFYNNILVGNTAIISGADTISKFFGNCWYSLTNGFNVNGIANFDSWRNQKHQEIFNGAKTGINIDPAFASINTINITDAKVLASFSMVKTANPLLINGGIDFQQLFSIPTGGKDFNGNAAQAKSIGASF
jgi:Right handed beta helix region